MQNSVNHRTFERNWRFQVPPGSMPLRVAPPPAWPRARVALFAECGARPLAAERGRRAALCLRTELARRLKARASPRARRGVRASGSAPTCYRFGDRRVGCLALLVSSSSSVWRGVGGVFRVCGGRRPRSVAGERSACVLRLSGDTNLSIPPSNEARLPAELKHITKRRRRN